MKIACTRALPPNTDLLVEAPEPFLLHVGYDGWRDVSDQQSVPLGMGMHGVHLHSGQLQEKRLLNMAIKRRDGDWDNQDYELGLDLASQSGSVEPEKVS